MTRRIVIAIGGNALYDKEGGNNLHPAQVEIICDHIVNVVRQGYLPVITFGNGPQVGNLLDMAETSARLFTSRVTLESCVAWTQGQMGYWLANTLSTRLIRAGLDATVMATITSVEVSPEDPAFEHPSKPIGKFITPEVAQRLYEERGWHVGPDSCRGYRRLVPSPRPKAILELKAIQTLIEQGVIVLCCGGGGVPVVRGDDGLKGVEAVIDKDYASCLLAASLGIETLVICTDVSHVYLDYGTPQAQALGLTSVEDARRYLSQGQFSSGSMGPKVEALLDYLDAGGKQALITSLDALCQALEGKIGTRFTRAATSEVM
ncbi:MAG: carbamate kinase [Vampirovibrionales bacterium]|nr:carbamate kinase [Vampirovibrionales bacterium]